MSEYSDEVDIDELADMMMLNPGVSTSELLEFLRQEAKTRGQK